MTSRSDRSVPWLRAGVALLSLALPGCPLSDDYYVEPAAGGGVSAGGNGGSTGKGGSLGTGGSWSPGGSSGTGGGGRGGSGGSSGTGGSAGATGGVAGVCTDCPPGCDPVVRNGKPYLFCTLSRYYSSAEEACADEGMTLVMIDDADEDAWVWATIDDLYVGTQPFAFIGASDRQAEGEWVFADGRVFWQGNHTGVLVGSHYVNWDDQQPSEFSPLTGSQEDCAAITLGNGAWNDVRCDLACPFVCEAN